MMILSELRKQITKDLKIAFVKDEITGVLAHLRFHQLQLVCKRIYLELCSAVNVPDHTTRGFHGRLSQLARLGAEKPYKFTDFDCRFCKPLLQDIDCCRYELCFCAR